VSHELKDLLSSVKEITSDSSKYRGLLEESTSIVTIPPCGGGIIKPGIIILPKAPCFLFIGDLHGDLSSTHSVLKSMWSELTGECITVFLGDYVDRGSYQLETLTLVLLLKKNYHEKIVLLRGNHEPPTWLTPYPHDYPYYLSTRFSSTWRDLYQTSLNLFNTLPLVAILEDFFIALHGGPPLTVLTSSSWQDAFEAGKEEFSSRVLEEILWSDPVEEDLEYLESPRGAGVLFGKKVTNKALKLIRGRYIIRGHEAVNGVKTNHNGLVFTVFTASIVYNLNCAGVLKLVYKENNYIPQALCIKPSSEL
jgi:protein phosphatase